MPPAFSGNPILPGRGVCDPHIRIFNDTAYLYATHDRCADASTYEMEDWWVWSSPDLVHWTHAGTLRPEDTYIGPGFKSCWATDALEKNGKYYWYFSEGARRTGVVVGESPTGPWRDPLGKPLVDESVAPKGAYDPGVLLDADGAAYIVFGVWDYYLARLGEDLISLAEAPRKLTIHQPEGPYGAGKMDDKPYLHQRSGLYYLSWGCYYGISESVYGPYECRGSLIRQENVAPSLRYASQPLTLDRHGSFFEWRGQWYYICNDMSRLDSLYFRDSVLSYVHYRANGEIEPVKLDPAGVTLAPKSG